MYAKSTDDIFTSECVWSTIPNNNLMAQQKWSEVPPPIWRHYDDYDDGNDDDNGVFTY